LGGVETENAARGSESTRLGTLEMVCYEVFINGKKICVAGVGELGVLAAHLTWVKRERHEADEGCDEDDTHVEELFVSVGGLAQHGKDPAHLNWLTKDLEVGDVVTFRIVEREICDPPEGARMHCAELIEKGRREYYEKLKQEYEGEEDKNQV
jgi:hypothetical protein